MRKTLATIALVLGLMFVGVPVFADGGDQPAPGLHLTPPEIPHCYSVGLELGTDDPPCGDSDPVTCEVADATCMMLCNINQELWSVECTFTDDRGVLTWANILYDLIDHYRGQADHATRVADRRAVRIHRQARRIKHLRARVRKLNRRHSSDTAQIAALSR